MASKYETLLISRRPKLSEKPVAPLRIEAHFFKCLQTVAAKSTGLSIRLEQNPFVRSRMTHSLEVAVQATWKTASRKAYYPQKCPNLLSGLSVWVCIDSYFRVNSKPQILGEEASG